MKIPIKPNNFCIMFIVVLVFLILVNITFEYTSNPVPYYPTSVFAKQFPYTEGFDGYATVPNAYPTNGSDTASTTATPNGVNMPYTGATGATGETGATGATGFAPAPQPPITTTGGSSSGIANFFSSLFSTSPAKTESFAGMGTMMAGSTQGENNLMYLADTNSSPDCANNSLALSNSRGYLCLSPQQINYIQGRGGNATTKGEF